MTLVEVFCETLGITKKDTSSSSPELAQSLLQYLQIETVIHNNPLFRKLNTHREGTINWLLRKAKQNFEKKVYFTTIFLCQKEFDPYTYQLHQNS